MRVTDKYVFFYGSPFSQWYKYRILVDGVSYSCAEQYMMAMKAFYFADRESYDAIMATEDPAKQKAIGRKVRGFDVAKWSAVSREYVYKANYAKFKNEPLRTFLLKTGDKEIVEASPTDKVWGIGLAEEDDRILDKNNWQGLNWLGECIMRAREQIVKEMMEEDV